LEVRVIQETGRGTFIVSIPKNWARKLGLKKGSKVFLELTLDDSIILRPEQHIEIPEIQNVLINAAEIQDTEILVREIISRYLSGYDAMEIVYPRSEQKLAREIKNFVKSKLIGLEVIEESSSHMVLRNLVKHNELPLNRIIEKMSFTALFMVKDAIDSLILGDKVLASSVLERDDEMDRFYFYAIRQLKQAISGKIKYVEIGLEKIENALDYRLLVKSLERIGDHASRIANISREIEKKNIRSIKNILESYSKDVIDIVEKTINIIREKNRDKAHQIINQVKELQDREKEIIRDHLWKAANNPITISNIRMVLDSLRRIADYSSDISEVIINIV